MPNELPSLEGADYRDAAASLNQNAAALAGLNANANPDEAARSAQLGKAAGVPGSVVQLNPKNFEERLKERAAVGLVGGNQSLAQYAGSDLLASIVSNDDWSVLDTLSQKLHGLRQATDVLTKPFQDAMEKAAKGGFEGLKEGWGEEPLFPVSNEDVRKAIPALDQDKGLVAGMENTLLTSALNLASMAMRAGGAVFEGTAGAAGGAAAGLTGSEQLGRDIKGIAEYEMLKPEHAPAAPWLMAGKEPPAGVSKELDAAKAEHNEQWLKGLEEASSIVQQSKTWERSPELFKKFVEQHVGDRTISISGDAVRTLYGDKIPQPNDGILGWVPDIGSKLLAATVDGSDVTVPLADWLTHMDPAVAKGLRDNVRMWPEGVTKAETSVAREPMPPPEPSTGEIGQVRQASGLEPVFRPVPVEEGAAADAGAAASGHPVLVGLHTIDPKTVGLKDEAWQKLQALAQNQLDDDFLAAKRKAERQQRKEQSAEWKVNRAEMEPQVEADIRAMPHVAADLFLGNGEINGEKVQQRFTLREADLTEEQKAALPSHYVSKNGLPIDAVATHFGFGSGDAMVEALAAHHVQKAGRSALQMFKDTVKAETDRRMQQKYGDLPANILKAAHEQALSDVTLDLVTKEYQAAAESAAEKARAAGTDPTEAVATKEQIQDQAKQIADGILNKDVNSRGKMAEISRHYSDAVKGLLGGDPALTVVSLQRRAVAAHVAKMLVEREKEIAQTESLMSKLAKWKEPGKNEVKAVDPEFLNWAHTIMLQAGQKIRRSLDSLREDIEARGDKTLQDFVDRKRGFGQLVEVWDQLYDATWKKDWDKLNGPEAQAFSGSLKSLDHWGRMEQKINVGNDLIDKTVAVEKMRDQLSRFDRLKLDISGNRADLMGRLTKVPRQFMVNVLQVETLLNYLDKFDPRGPWTQYIMRGLVDGSNQAEAWAKEFAKRLGEANDKADLSKEVDNPLFRVPLEDGEGLGPLFRMTRENLRMVLLNAGNSAGPRSNLMKLAKGYDLKPEEIMAWLDKHATKEDWDWAQKVWDNVFEGMWKHGAEMYRSLTGGVTPERIRIDPIQTRFGEYRGGYMPVDYHPNFPKRRITDLDGLAQSNYLSAMPQASWSKERTGAHGPLNLDMSRLPMLITRELHDIAMRPSLIQASKLLLDSRVQGAVASKMGIEYNRMLEKYLVGVANRQNYLTTHPAYANSMLETLRKNLVTGLVGFNPGTVMKHAPTAFILTMREIGPEYMLRAYKALYSLNSETSQAANDLVMSSHEIMRRDRNWEETLYGEMLKQRPGGQSETWTNQLAKYSAKPVAWSDMFSAKAALLGQYMKSIDEGLEHGDAMYMAERAVRRAHGSTALTNRPAVMRDWNPWLTSVYTFFNDIVNRQMEMAWRAGEMLRDRKEEGSWEAAKAHLPAITASLFAAVIAPAIIEELVSPSHGPNDKEEGITGKILKGGAYTISSGLPGVREFVHGILSGTDPTPAGLAKTAAIGLQNVHRDLMVKKDPWSPAHAQRLLKDLAGPLAMMTGKVTQSMGNVAAFGYGYAKGLEKPKNPWHWFQGLRYGTLKNHI